MKCASRDCAEPATLEVFWPGRVAAALCRACVYRFHQVARTLGFGVEMHAIVEPGPDDLISQAEAARRLHLSRAGVAWLWRRGLLGVTPVGGRRFCSAQEVASLAITRRARDAERAERRKRGRR